MIFIKTLLAGAICLLSLSPFANAWDSEQFEVFDIVEEVGQNFYNLLGVPEDASASEIKKAFRQLSLKLHPDKNPAEDAEIQFRNLVSVYEVLKDPKKRSIYADVLINGLPDWKQAMYYFRRVRKMGLGEMTVILFVIITIGQYLVAWAAYFEKRYAIQEFIDTKKKSLEKKQRKGKIEHGTVEMLPELVSSIPRPTLSCTLPVQIPKFIWFMVVQFPPLCYNWVKDYIRTRNEKVETEEESSEEEEVAVVRVRGPRRRKGGFQAPEIASNQQSSQPVVANQTKTKQNNHQPATPIVKGGLWTDDDFDDLIRLMKKYPAGTQDRWDKIGEIMRRAGTEVAHMAHKIKDEGFNPFKQSEETEEPVVEVKKTKTRKVIEENVNGTDNSWSQVQQKALEAALAKFPKGSASGDRWEKIAHCVPGKTKEECMVRFKHLADMVKKKKEKGSTDDDNDNIVCEQELNGETITTIPQTS